MPIVIPESSTRCATSNSSSTTITPLTNVITSNSDIPTPLLIANRPIIILGDSMLTKMFGPNRSKSVPTHTDLLSLPPAKIPLVSEHSHTSTLCNTNPHPLALPSAVCSLYDKEIAHSSPNTDDHSSSPTDELPNELPKEVDIEKDGLVPESPQICIIPDSPQNEGCHDTSMDSKQATSTQPTTTQIEKSSTDKQVTNCSDTTPRKDYGENILNAWTSSILSLSESAGHAGNKSTLSAGSELTVPEDLTLTDKPQSMLSFSKIEPLDLSNFTLNKQCQPSPYISCIEGREEQLLDDSDSELELPQLSPKDITADETFSCFKQSNKINLSTTVQSNDNCSETQAEGAEPTSKMLESVSIQSPDGLKSDCETKSQDETEQFSIVCDVAKLSPDGQTRKTHDQTICSQDYVLQNSRGTLNKSDLSDTQHASVHSKNIDTKVGELSHETDKAQPSETGMVLVTESVNGLKDEASQDSETTEPLPKRRKLQSASAHDDIHFGKEEDFQTVLCTQTLELSSKYSVVECSNQEALDLEENNMDQPASSQEHLQPDTCINGELYPEPMLVVTQHSTSNNTCFLSDNPEVEATMPEHTGISVYPCEPFEGADDGIDTINQALPTECARLHALVPNLAKCAREVEQESENDDSDDEAGVGQVVGEPGVLPADDHQSQAEEGGCTDYADDNTTVYHQTELAGQFISEHQIVPDQVSLDSSFSSKSMFADELKDKPLPETSVSLQTLDEIDIENIDDTTVLSLALESIESRRSSEDTVPSFCQQRVVCPPVFPNRDIEEDVSNAYSLVGTRASYRKDAYQSCTAFKGSKGKLLAVPYIERFN